MNLAFLFVLHARSSCFTHGVRESKLICACATFAHAVLQLLCARKTRTKGRVSHTPFKNSYFRYKCEKVILSSWGRLRPSEARVKRSYEDKITFSHAYRTQFFHTTCAKLDLAHAVLLERAQSNTLRTECEKVNFVSYLKIVDCDYIALLYYYRSFLFQF